MGQDSEFIPVSKPHIWGKEKEYVSRAIEEGWISSKGRYIQEFEAVFADYLGVKHALAVSSGTTALHLAVDAIGIGEGDEVIVPDFVMIAPVFAVLYQGAVPVPVDADETWNIDPEKIEGKITSRTRAVMVVHTYGHPARIDSIKELATRHGLQVVEDGAEALGADIVGAKVGTFGDVACFSFYANKLITTGEGGMLVTDRTDLFEKAAAKRNMCFGRDVASQYRHEEIGYNYRLTNLQAGIGLAQIEHIDEALEQKICIGRLYDDLLSGERGLTLPPQSSWATNVYWMYGILVGEEYGLSRARLQRRLFEAGIDSRRFFTPVHRQPVCDWLIKDSDFPVSDSLWREGIYLPTFVGMKEEQVLRIAEKIKELSGGG